MRAQTSFFNSKSEFSQNRISHGGDLRGKRKVFRPLDRKRPLHITMKSSVAKGRLSLLTQKLEVDRIVREWAKTCLLTIHGFENVGNHLHIFVSLKTREGLQKFLRTVAGLIAKLITKAKRGKPFGKRFWDHLAFTRIITGRRDFAKISAYLNKNSVERDSGAKFRKAMEFHEQLSATARTKKISLLEVMTETLHKFANAQFAQTVM